MYEVRWAEVEGQMLKSEGQITQHSEFRTQNSEPGPSDPPRRAGLAFLGRHPPLVGWFHRLWGIVLAVFPWDTRHMHEDKEQQSFSQKHKQQPNERNEASSACCV